MNRALLILLALEFALCGIVRAQVPNGSITGLVTDPSGAAIPGASVVVTNKETGLRRALAVSEAGEFSAPALLPGIYEVTADAKGFKHLAGESIIEAGIITSVNLTMEVGPASRHGHKSYLLELVIPCLLVPFAAPRLNRAQHTGWIMVAAWAAGCFIANALPGRWQEYQLEIWMPVYALAGGAMFAGLASGEIERPRVWRWVLLAMVLGPLVNRAMNRHQYGVAPWSVYDLDGPEYQFRHSSRDAALAINQMLLPGERMYALGVPGESCALHFNTQQSPPTGVFFDFPLRPGSPLAAKLEDRVIRDLERDPPDLIVLSTARFLALLDGKRVDWAQRLIAWVTAHYSRRGFDPTKHFLLFARRGSAIEKRFDARE